MAALSGSTGSGLVGGAFSALSMGGDFLVQATGGGDAPSDPNPIANLIGTVLDPGVLVGLVGGAVEGAVTGGIAFVGNGGIEATVAGVAAAAGAGFTPASIATGATAFLGSGGATALLAAADGGLSGFASGGGMEAVGKIVHEAGASVGGVVNDVGARLAQSAAAVPA